MQYREVLNLKKKYMIRGKKYSGKDILKNHKGCKVREGTFRYELKYFNDTPLKYQSSYYLKVLRASPRNSLYLF